MENNSSVTEWPNKCAVDSFNLIPHLSAKKHIPCRGARTTVATWTLIHYLLESLGFQNSLLLPNRIKMNNNKFFKFESQIYKE